MKIGDGHPKESFAGSRPWGKLDTNLLQKIFQLVAAEDLLSEVCLVCRSWRSACWEVLFWKNYETLELNNLKRLLGPRIPYRRYPERLLQSLICMMNPHALESQRCATNIEFPRHMYLCDQDLIFIAERSPRLKRLVLPDTQLLTASSFTKAANIWRDLEEISFGPLLNLSGDQIIQEIGNMCKNLNTLCIHGMYSMNFKNFKLDEYNSTVIAKSLPQLKVFRMDNALLYKNGIITILRKCKQLSELNFKCCNRVMDRQPCCRIPVKILREGMSVIEIYKKLEGNCNKWSIGSLKGLYSKRQLIDHLWQEDP